MSKVSFRARALDATKPMPVFRAEEIPDLPDFATINRSVPQMPTGMEREEETEHHLQRALSAQQVYGTSEVLVIPIPEVDDNNDRYDHFYKSDFKQPKQYIHIQAFSMDQEIPDYDMDSEDESWLNEQAKKIEITPLQFEEMMDRLEKGSGQQVVTLQEAKLLLKKDDDVIMAVYDYWLNKRLKIQQPLIPTVKTEKRDGSTTNNPYVAFRRRTEKMQTRKNRKNDEVSYEKMLKLQRDLRKAVSLLEFVKRREKMKKEMLQLTIEVLEKRFQGEDFSGQMLSEAEAQRYTRPAFIPPFIHRGWAQDLNGEDIPPVRKKREYRKRKHKQTNQISNHTSVIQSSQFGDIDVLHPDVYSSDDELLSPGMSQSDHEDENDPDGAFVFRRKRGCNYFTPLLESRNGDWPYNGPDGGGFNDKKNRFSLTTLPTPFRRRCVGYARRRIGRGGRVVIDRIPTEWDDNFQRLDLCEPSLVPDPWSEYVTYIREKKIPHFRPKTPPEDSSSGRLGNISPTCCSPVTEFNFESFLYHKEQLVQMQREQQEQLLRQEASTLNSSINLEHSFSSQPTSQFTLDSTLDSSRAKFAVSAVIESSQLQNSLNGVTMCKSSVSSVTTSSLSTASPVLSSLSSVSSAPTVTISTSTPVTTTLTNGPISHTAGKVTGLSTSPSATVLQLNFPLVMSSQATPTSLSTLHCTSSPANNISSIITCVNSVFINKNIVTSSNSSLLKLANQLPPNAIVDAITKTNHEDPKQLNTHTLAMDVT